MRSTCKQLFATRWLVTALTVLMLAACASGGGSLMPADPSTAYGSQQSLSGTLGNVDHGNHRLLLQEDSGDSADLSYDLGSRLLADGQARDIASLAPGNRVRVLAVRDGRLWRVQDIELLDADAGSGTADFSNVQSGSATRSDSQERSGVVTGVDRRAGLIRFTDGGFTGREDSVRYDARTTGVGELERGDLIRVRMRRSDTGWIANSVVVERHADDR